MNASTEVPVTITTEAEARLAELGMRNGIGADDRVRP